MQASVFSILILKINYFSCTIIKVPISISFKCPFCYSSWWYSLFQTLKLVSIVKIFTYGTSVRITKQAAITPSSSTRIWPRVDAKITVSATPNTACLPIVWNGKWDSSKSLGFPAMIVILNQRKRIVDLRFQAYPVAKFGTAEPTLRSVNI